MERETHRDRDPEQMNISILFYYYLPEKSSLLSGCIPVSNPIKVSEETADHVQEVKATHSHLPSYLILPPGPETVNAIFNK